MKECCETYAQNAEPQNPKADTRWKEKHKCNKCKSDIVIEFEMHSTFGDNPVYGILSAYYQKPKKN